MKTPLIETTKLSIATNEGRVLLQGLTMSFALDQVALIGRNGVGKSTLLHVLAGKQQPSGGKIIHRTQSHYVEQNISRQQVKKWMDTCCKQLFAQTPQNLSCELQAAGLCHVDKIWHQDMLSHGELRKLQLLIAKISNPLLLVLDEPTQDLDQQGREWLQQWLSQWKNGLLVVSHDPFLLQNFQHFFIISETGCRYFCGEFLELQQEMEKEYKNSQKRYLRNINRLLKKEEHNVHIARRRGRKKRYGRISELDRATPRQTLNQKRDYAQVKHGRMKKTRDNRIEAIREWTKSTRHSLDAKLPLTLPHIKLPPAHKNDIVILKDISFVTNKSTLFENINLRQNRQKIAIVGANGTGKTTLLEIILGRKKPTTGVALKEEHRIGYIAQSGENWMLSQSLLSQLTLETGIEDPSVLTQLLIAHKFPLALAQRSMLSLSPGERIRAALICIFQKVPELLILDEPTCNLDIVGQKALKEALSSWEGGLLIASHNLLFLEGIGIEEHFYI